MIYYVSGPVTVLEPGLAVVECAGVGYGCRITAYTASQLKLNQNTRLYVTESIREDAHDLYGFSSRMIRWAIFLPMPWAAVSIFSSPVITARVKFWGPPADKMEIAALGPTPLTEVSSS